MKTAIRRADDSIHSMVSMQPLPGLLHHIGGPVPRNRFTLLQVAIVLIAGGAHAASMAWPFSFGFAHGQPIWWMQVLAMVLLVGQLDAQVSSRGWKRAAGLGGLFATPMAAWLRRWLLWQLSYWRLF